MKKNLTLKETIYITSMLFGMFFGAGNLIFPIYMGQLAGSNMWKASVGFLVTGVGLPMLGVASLGISRSDGLLELSGKVGKRYSVFFTCLLYLTIGPFFAIPRCATVPFTVAVAPMLGDGVSQIFPLVGFSALFFAAVLIFSLFPSGILTWVGKVLNPIFLVSLGILLVTALISPMGEISQIVPAESYENGAFFAGFIEGYNTMDALAALAFGIIVITVIRDLGVRKAEYVAINTVRAGVLSCVLMGIIYVAVTAIGAQSRGIYPASANGGEAFAVVAKHYFGAGGMIILALTVTFACLKTAVGLITSCSETFSEMFANGPSYKVWAIIFCAVSFLIANAGLDSIIEYSLPVLMFLYPLAITLILLGLFGNFFGHSQIIYRCVTGFTFVAALFDLVNALPKNVVAALHLEIFPILAKEYLPFFEIGLGWICPAVGGLAIGIIVNKVKMSAQTGR